MNSAAAEAAASAGVWTAPFTASQWVELEHRALIFKYLMAGVPVPPDLLVPIRGSFDVLHARYLPTPPPPLPLPQHRPMTEEYAALVSCSKLRCKDVAGLITV